MIKNTTGIIAQDEEIVIGVDVSDKKHHLAASDLRGNILKIIVLTNPTNRQWTALLENRFPGCRLTVVYEAGPQGYTLYDLVRSVKHEAVVIAPQKGAGPVKTNTRDCQAIVRDYLSNRARKVTVPSAQKRAMRQVLRTRDALRKEITQTMNRINGTLRFHALTGTMTPVHPDESGLIAGCVEKLRQVETHLKALLAECDKELRQIARTESYRREAQLLLDIPGVGIVTAVQILLNVPGMENFPHPDNLASFLGLTPREWSTGDTRRLGRITRRGPGAVRGALVQCAWVCIRCDEQERLFFEQLKARRGKKRAIVAVARRLAVRIWRTLTCAAAPEGARIPA
jgi:transposase